MIPCSHTLTHSTHSHTPHTHTLHTHTTPPHTHTPHRLAVLGSTSFDGRSSTPPTHNTADNARRDLFGAPPFGEGSKVTTTMTSVDQFGAVPEF